MGKRISIVSTLFLVFWAASLGAITLEECIQEVLETNPRILEKLKY